MHPAGNGDSVWLVWQTESDLPRFSQNEHERVVGYRRESNGNASRPSPDPLMQSRDFSDDHRLRRYSRRFAGRQRARDLLKMFKPHSDMKPVENWRFGDSGICENASNTRTSIGEGRQFAAFRSADGVKAPADHYHDVRIGFRDGSENLSCRRTAGVIAGEISRLARAGRSQPAPGRQGRKPPRTPCRRGSSAGSCSRCGYPRSGRGRDDRRLATRTGR